MEVIRELWLLTILLIILVLFGTVLYLLFQPLGYKSYRDQARAAETTAPAGGEVPSPPSAPTLANLSEPPHEDDRPGRLH